MKEYIMRYFALFAVSVAALLTLSLSIGMAAEDKMELPPARKIPGLTAEDKFPNGCVDCHINMPERKQDERISTLMSTWNNQADPNLMKKAQAAAPAGVKLQGKHPPATYALKNIPAACATCHSKTSKTIPPLGPLLHSIHLTGGGDNHFLAIFQGECTHCHKFDASTGDMTMPSGPEKK